MIEDKSITIHAIVDAMGEDSEEFIAVMEIVDDMIANPNNYHGPTAGKYAALLSAYRTRISAKAQYYKWQKNAPYDVRARKDTLMAMYAGLEENINCLKLLARFDSKQAGVL